MKTRNLVPLTNILSAMLMLYAILMGVRLFFAVAPFGMRVRFAALDMLSPWIGLPLTLATVVAFAVWIHLAGQNLVAMGRADLRFSPAGRIWWLAVPVASLVQSYRGMRELWNASHCSVTLRKASLLVALWWLLWIPLCDPLALFLRVLGLHTGNRLIPWIPQAWLISGYILLALVAVAMIQRIARAQIRLREAMLAQVFA